MISLRVIRLVNAQSINPKLSEPARLSVISQMPQRSPEVLSHWKLSAIKNDGILSIALISPLIGECLIYTVQIIKICSMKRTRNQVRLRYSSRLQSNQANLGCQLAEWCENNSWRFARHSRCLFGARILLRSTIILSSSSRFLAFQLSLVKKLS